MMHPIGTAPRDGSVFIGFDRTNRGFLVFWDHPRNCLINLENDRPVPVQTVCDWVPYPEDGDVHSTIMHYRN